MIPPLLLVVLLLAAPSSSRAARPSAAEAAARAAGRIGHRRILSLHHDAQPSSHDDPLRTLRGGSSTAVVAEDSADAVRQYQTQQQLLLQSRSIVLRQALIERGLTGLAFQAADDAAPTAVDWDVALATAQSPKSCLYSFDAETGAKVICPRDTTQWITLTALNRLRRTDPTKVEPLWHSQYHILKAWFHPSHTHSLYTYLSPRTALLSFVLDAPWALGLALTASAVVAFLMTFPVWEALATNVLTSSALWLQWPQWGRFVHAAFPLKLLLGQMMYKAVASALGRVYGRVRSHLIELECQWWEDSIPRTIIEDDDDDDDDELDDLGDLDELEDDDDDSDEDEEVDSDEEDIDLR